MRFFLIFLFTLLVIFSCNQPPREVQVIDPSQTDDRQTTQMVEQDYRPLKVAVSAILSPRETFESYEDIFRYISEQLNMPIEFHQRRTYQEINKMLEEGQLDFAFICSGAYAELDLDQGVELFASPVSNGEINYNAYIIAHENFRAEKLEDLHRATFAYTDPLSNTGYLYIKYRLMEMGMDHNTFFSSTVFTHGHDVSIQMVSKGIVEAASVSNLVFEYLREKSPERVKNVKVIEVSENFGMPPVVVTSRMENEMRKKITEIFANMHEDSKAKVFMEELLIDSFIEARNENYESIRHMRDAMNP
jgi:phosphonate transport system substrate-binding protein